LIITHVALNRKQHPYYDEGVGEPLYDLKTEDGKNVGLSLYAYELDDAKGGKCGGKFVGKLPNVKDKIGTAAGEARYIGTEVENEHGKWDDSYTTKDGYWVIHEGKEHHIYEVKGGKCGGKIKEVMTEEEAEKQFEKELDEGTINTDDTPHYNSFNQYKNMLQDMGVKIKRGGKCSPSDLKYGTAPDSQFDAKALKAGIKVETEHTSSRKVAKAIAKAHLKEMPDYYTKLKRMEKGGKIIPKKLGKRIAVFKRKNEFGGAPFDDYLEVPDNVRSSYDLSEWAKKVEENGQEV